MADIARLPDAVRRRELARVPKGESEERVVRALFWTLVYHLEPERWDELARAEPIAPALIEMLPRDLALTVDVGAGSGRLTQHLATRAGEVVAVEPAAGLGAILRRRLPRVRVVAGWAEALPLADHRAQLAAACGAFGPDDAVLSELRRVTAPGGVVALISPEQPEWFEARGWRRLRTDPPVLPPRAEWLDGFFGPPDPPHELVMTTV